MGARTGGGAAGGMGGGSRGAVGRMASEYMSGVSTDISAYEEPGGAVGKLIGDAQTKALDELKATLGEVKGLKSVTDVHNFGSKVEKAFAKFDKDLSEKVSILQHNSQLAQGKAKQTYANAINTIGMTQWKVGKFKAKYSFGKPIADMEAHFISKNKW